MNQTVKNSIKIPKILLPNKNIDLKKWAVVACDQYTSEPEYWKEVERIVGENPSTLKITYPEIFLKSQDKKERIENIKKEMKKYLEQKIFEEHENIIYVERQIDSGIRKGIIVALDLEAYDYNKGSKSLIRATEGTILDRLPPRMEIRKDALIELPHILVLIDDPKRTVIEPIAEMKKEKLYDFDLMMGGGNIKGYKVSLQDQQKILDALYNLADVSEFKKKYSIDDEEVLLFAMGDGNHSLATAKAIWDQTKKEKGMNHPSRYALVEIVNVQSEAIVFEPIHRILFNLKTDFIYDLKKVFNNEVEIIYSSFEEMKKQVFNSKKQTFGCVSGNECKIITFKNPDTNLVYGTLQPFLDKLMSENLAHEIDYVHGDDVIKMKGTVKGNVGIYLPAIRKDNFFKTVIIDGALPRKTFSMGEAKEKRYYLEARKIV